MYRKAKKINVILVISVFVLSSCNQSYFQMLTHNDVGYWRKEKWVDPIYGYSKNDTTHSVYSDNMVQHHYQWVWLEMCEHKYCIYNDMFYHYNKDKETGKCYRDETYRIISFKRNKLKMIYIPTELEKAKCDYSKDTITLVRVKNRDIKRLRKGKKVTYKDCKDGGYKVVVKILDRNDRKQQEKNSQEE